MEAKELYEKLSSFYQEKVELEAQKVEMAIRLQEELASVLDLRKKDGEVDVKAVKLPIVIAVVEAMRKSKENKYKLDAILASDIEKALENGELDTAFKAYDGVLNELDDNKTNIKEAFKKSKSQKMIQKLEISLMNCKMLLLRFQKKINKRKKYGFFWWK